MQRGMIGLTLLAALLAGSAQTRADTFVNPPETNWSPPWVGGFPYQRNISWDFHVSPVGGPSSGGTPGAVYEGYLDPTLRASDIVAFTGNVQWYASVDTSGGTYTNAIGIVNNSTTDTLTGTAVFHLDNTPIPDFQKNVWIEETGASTAGDAATLSLNVPNGYTASGVLNFSESQIGTSPLLVRQNFGFTAHPNPPWEEIVVTFSVAPGGYDLFNSWHVATQSVPEPASLGMLGIGILGAVVYARRRRKQE